MSERNVIVPLLRYKAGFLEPRKLPRLEAHKLLEEGRASLPSKSLHEEYMAGKRGPWLREAYPGWGKEIFVSPEKGGAFAKGRDAEDSEKDGKGRVWVLPAKYLAAPFAPFDTSLKDAALLVDPEAFELSGGKVYVHPKSIKPFDLAEGMVLVRNDGASVRGMVFGYLDWGHPNELHVEFDSAGYFHVSAELPESKAGMQLFETVLLSRALTPSEFENLVIAAVATAATKLDVMRPEMLAPVRELLDALNRGVFAPAGNSGMRLKNVAPSEFAQLVENAKRSMDRNFGIVQDEILAPIHGVFNALANSQAKNGR